MEPTPNEDVVVVNKCWSSGAKWGLALAIGILAAIIFSTPVYGLTNKISQGIKLPKTTVPGGPTIYGFILHVIVFALLTRLILW